MWLESPWGLCLPGELGLAPGAAGGAVPVALLCLGPSEPSRATPSISLGLTSVVWNAVTLFCSLKGQQGCDSESLAWVSCFGATVPGSDVQPQL